MQPLRQQTSHKVTLSEFINVIVKFDKFPLVLLHIEKKSVGRGIARGIRYNLTRM